MNVFVNTLFRTVITIAALLPLTAAQAADSAPGLQVVNVSGLSNPDERGYAKMVDAMDLFKKLHAMAPLALLRFELLPAHAGVAMKSIELNVVTGERRMAVELADDRTFTIARLPIAQRARAMVSSNRRDGSLLWRAHSHAGLARQYPASG